jgi:hypothetical protein
MAQERGAIVLSADEGDRRFVLADALEAARFEQRCSPANLTVLSPQIDPCRQATLQNLDNAKWVRDAASALIATEADARLWEPVKVGEPFPDEIIREHRASRARVSEQSNARQRLARQRSMRRFEKFSPENDLDGDLMDYRDEIMRQLRMDELLPADSEWRGARHQAKVDSGAQAAVERQEQLLSEELDLQERIPGMLAQTAPGALAKIALVADYHGDPTFGGDDEQFFD